MRLSLLVLVSTLCLLLASPSRAAAPSSDIETLFTEANTRFREATTKLESEPDAAQALLRESLVRFQAILDTGVENGKLHYNIGNVHTLLGDTGRAIASYRRAERFMPRDENLQRNLHHARSRTRDRIPVEARQEALRALLFWRDALSDRSQWWIFAISFQLFWIVGALRAATAHRRAAASPLAPRWLMLTFGAVALIFAASLAADHLAPGPAEGVIVAPEVVGRKGPDAVAYEPSFTQPLHAGVELKILERRADWRLARLADGRETWLPVSAIELIDRGREH